MKFRLITFCMLASAMAGMAIGQPAAAQGAPPPPGAAMHVEMQTKQAPLGVGAPGLLAPPTPAMRSVMSATAAYADKQCTGKDGDAATDCRLTALWDATQCTAAPAKTDTPAPGGAPGKLPDAPTDEKCAQAAGPSQFEYEVASLKPHKDDGGGRGNFMMMGGTDDTYRAVNTTVRNMVQNAFSTGLQMEIKNMPDWASSEHYDVDAKMTPEVADALKKLSPDDRGLARRYMMLQVVKDRLNLKAHLETKEVPAYDMVIGKNGPKLKDADPNAKENGTMRMTMNQDKMVLTATGMNMTMLARNLQNTAGRPVFDKTGLTGTYDFTLEYAPGMMNGIGPGMPVPPGGTAAGAGPATSIAPAVSDPVGGAATAQDAIATLGLKLVASHGPMNVLVIEHIDKPDAN